MAALFVLLWSTGFVGAKYGLPDAEPFVFLALRLAIAAALLAVAALVTGSRITRGQLGRAAVSGLLLHATYLGGVFWAISRGTPAGVSAVVVSLQPVLVAALAIPLLAERLRPAQWLGLALGVAGVVLVVVPRLGGTLPVRGVVACLVALAGGTLGTLWQKRYGDGVPLLWGTAVQYAAATVVLATLSAATEQPRLAFTPRLVGALVWLVLVLSLGAVLLLLRPAAPGQRRGGLQPALPGAPRHRRRGLPAVRRAARGPVAGGDRGHRPGRRARRTPPAGRARAARRTVTACVPSRSARSTVPPQCRSCRCRPRRGRACSSTCTSRGSTSPTC